MTQEPCNDPLCPICHPLRPLVVLIADDETQKWRISERGNVVPVFVEEANEADHQRK